MDRSEAYDLIAQLEQDLAAEPDPDVRAWYRVESELQPEIAEAKKVVIGDIASLIGRLVELKSGETASEQLAEQKDEGLDPNEIPETPHIPTAGEILWSRIDRKYDRLYGQYQQDLKAISSSKKSKREHQENIARRKFARQFNDFSDLTGDENSILQAELLGLVAIETISDEELRKAVFANAAEYAQKNAKEVTKDPKNFAHILAASVEGRPLKSQFESIIKGIFATNPTDMPELHARLAYAAFELLEDFEALKLLMEIVYLKKNYVPVALHSERMKVDMINVNSENYSSLLETNQINSVFRSINVDITGLRYYLDQKPGASQQIHRAVTSVMADSTASKSGQELANIPETGTDYDPVEVFDISGEHRVDLGIKPITDALRENLESSELFRLRMQKLSPYSYAVRAAKKLLKAEGVHGLSMPLSPNIAIDIYFPMVANGPPSPAELQGVSERFGDMHNEVLQHAIEANKLGFSTYQDSGRLQMFYHPLSEGDIRKGVIIYRPAIPTDKYTHSPLQQLAISYAAIRGNEILKGSNLEDFEEAELQQENERLRQEIKDQQKRFLGRRPIKFAMPIELRQMAGLVNVSLRYNPREHDIKYVLSLDDGEVELTLDRELRVNDEGKISLAYPGIRQYYENLVLKLAKKWMCTQEIHTSEGIVSERSGNSANMGHYAYLRIREDGRRYHFSETQRIACIEEQGKDLATESERLKHLDPTGRMRNSTYVRENYDPSKPPLEVYYSALD